MDCSRTSLRHGAENVTIAYRRTRSELVVDEEELGETEREGVRMEFLVSPIELVGEDGQAHGGPLHPQQARRARRLGPPLAGADRRVGVRGPRRHRHPGGLAGRGPELPAGRVQLRGGPRPATRRSRHLRHQRARRLRLRRLRDRAHHPHRVGRPRQEMRLRDRPLPGRPSGRQRGRQRQDHQLLAPRDAGVLRRPAAPARALAGGGPSGCRRATRTSTSRPRSSWATRRRRRWPSPRAASCATTTSGSTRSAACSAGRARTSARKASSTWSTSTR